MILQIFGVLLLSLGIWMLITWDRKLDNKNLFIVILLGIIFIFLGVKILFGGFDFSIIWRRMIGIVLGFIGVFFIIGFPDVSADYQSPGMTRLIAFLGIILLVTASYLLII